MTETPTATQWFIARDGAQHGPLSDAEIRMFVQVGHMRPTDLVWRPGFADWQPAASVFPPPAQQPSAPPQAATPAPGPRSPAETSQPRVEPRFPQAGQAPSMTRMTGDGSPARPGDRASQGSPAAADADRRHQEHQTRSPERSATRIALADQVEDEYVDEDAPATRRRFGGRGAAVVIGLVALMAGGGWLIAQNQDAIFAMANMTSSAEGGPPVVKADGETKTAALDQDQSVPEATDTEPSDVDTSTPAVNASTQKPAVTPQMIDENFQRSPLWSRLKTDFPDWYQQNVDEAARIVSAGTEADMSKHLIVQLVDLRRKNAEHALAADTAKLINIAQSFLTNMKSLAAHSESTCYSFIGQGESSPAVIELFPQRGYGEAIEAQIAAIFEAVSSGREAPISRVRATKSDYDVLAAELTKLGWSKADLRVFADPKALAETEPGKVCQMVQDWFTAHLAIGDTAVQERLLFETLRPIVAG